MKPGNEKGTEVMRREMAARVRTLRRTRHVWAPNGAPYDRMRLRRGIVDVTIASLNYHPASLSALIFAANHAGHHDLDRVCVKYETRPDDYEEWEHEYMALTTPGPAPDVMYAKQIAEVWREYIVANQTTEEQKALYAQYLLLKAHFEPDVDA